MFYSFYSISLIQNFSKIHSAVLNCYEWRDKVKNIPVLTGIFFLQHFIANVPKSALESIKSEKTNLRE